MLLSCQLYYTGFFFFLLFCFQCMISILVEKNPVLTFSKNCAALWKQLPVHWLQEQSQCQNQALLTKCYVLESRVRQCKFCIIHIFYFNSILFGNVCKFYIFSQNLDFYKNVFLQLMLSLVYFYSSALVFIVVKPFWFRSRTVE